MALLAFLSVYFQKQFHLQVCQRYFVTHTPPIVCWIYRYYNHLHSEQSGILAAPVPYPACRVGCLTGRGSRFPLQSTSVQGLATPTHYTCCKYWRISSNSILSVTRSQRTDISLSWFTRSKNFSKSSSTTLLLSLLIVQGSFHDLVSKTLRTKTETAIIATPAIHHA